MKLHEVRSIAKRKGINPARMGKADVIRAIQRSEGNFDCYGTAVGGSCDQAGCAWMKDCLAESAGRREM